MSILATIYRKRLNRIREELNTYINSNLPVSEDIFWAPVLESTPVEKKKGGVQEKFLNYMKLNSSEYEIFEEEDECEEVPSNKMEMEPLFSMTDLKQPSVSKDSSTFGTPTGTAKIPDFLIRDSKHAELDKVLEKKEESFSEMLLRMIDEKGLKDSDVYKRANIDRRLFSKIRGDADYVPSKKTAISFCLALQLETEEAKKLLATAGYTLSASSRFDLIIMYLIETKEYNIHFANIVLDDYGEGTLSR